jgi:hypothetical protein
VPGQNAKDGAASIASVPTFASLVIRAEVFLVSFNSRVVGAVSLTGSCLEPVTREPFAPLFFPSSSRIRPQRRSARVGKPVASPDRFSVQCSPGFCFGNPRPISPRRRMRKAGPSRVRGGGGATGPAKVLRWARGEKSRARRGGKRRVLRMHAYSAATRQRRTAMVAHGLR